MRDTDDPDTQKSDSNGEDADDADSGTSGVELGEACADDTDCSLGRCIVDDGFLDGYCTTPDACESDEQCPDESTCFDNGGDTFCGARCEEGSDCRDGYDCQESAASSYKACAREVVELDDTELDGSACASDAECDSAFAVRFGPAGIA